MRMGMPKQLANRRALTAWLGLAAFLGPCACRSSIDARVVGTAAAEEPEARSDRIVREFDVESLRGLRVDAAASGLGLDLVLPEDSAAVSVFKLVVTLDTGGGAALGLTLASDIASLERPAAVTIPRAMLPDGVRPERSALVVRTSGVSRRVLAPEALQWTDTGVVVRTAQPMGEWALVSDASATAAPSELVIAVTGLAADESLRYEVELLGPALESRGYEIELPGELIRQKVTGNEVRRVSAPAGARSRFRVAVLEAPVRLTCVPARETGVLTGSEELAIRCDAR